ncbi:hypothetical protein [Sporofaciens sp. JLR.KK001]|uniref:hypothetical protein n=1 Tax=Sporofaciens sp. JLR.KK001 TaxID=3112621 RepID=UPI002FF37CD2
MRNAKVSKILAASMAATMLLTPATVLADDVVDISQAGGEVSGSGDFEGYVDKNVFRVVLPTISDVNFTMDPQGLLHGADASTYPTEGPAVYFANAPADAGDPTAYSNTSDGIVFVNKSSYDIKVGLAVTLNTGDITLAKAADVASATTPSLNLGLKKDSEDAVDIDSAAFKSAADTVDAVPAKTDSADGYYVKAEQGNPGEEGVSPNGYKYSYALDDSYTAGADQTVTYKLTGACNDVAGWGNIKNKNVTAKIAWTITDATAPAITGTAYSVSSKTNTYTLENISQGITSIGVSTDGTTVSGNLPDDAYSVASNTLTIDGTKNTFVGSGGVGKVRYFFVTFADGSKIKFSVNVAA